MLGKRFAFALMAAMGAAMSAGGTAIAAEPVVELGGPLTLKHRVTHQENHFDTLDAARGFMESVDQPDAWGMKHVVDAEIEAATNPGAGYAAGDAQGADATTAPADAGDNAELLPGGETDPEASAATTDTATEAAPEGTGEAAEVVEA